MISIVEEVMNESHSQMKVIATLMKCRNKKKNLRSTIKRLKKTIEGLKQADLCVSSLKVDDYEIKANPKIMPVNFEFKEEENRFKVNFVINDKYVKVEFEKLTELPKECTPGQLIKVVSPNVEKLKAKLKSKMLLAVHLSKINERLYGESGLNRISLVQTDYYKPAIIDVEPITRFDPIHIQSTIEVYKFNDRHLISVEGIDYAMFLLRTAEDLYCNMKSDQVIKVINEIFESIGRQVRNFSIVRDSVNLEGYKRPKSDKYNKFDPSQIAVLKKGDDFLLALHNTSNVVYHVSTKKIPR